MCEQPNRALCTRFNIEIYIHYIEITWVKAMTEEDIIFDERSVSEIVQEQKKARKDYGNKYELNRSTISVVDTLFERLEAIQTRKGFKKKGELLEYLVEVEEISKPKTETIYECKKCHQKVDAHKDININRLIHKDLCKDSPCNGSIITKQKIKIEVLPGATEQSDTLRKMFTMKDGRRVSSKGDMTQEAVEKLYEEAKSNSQMESE